MPGLGKNSRVNPTAGVPFRGLFSTRAGARLRVNSPEMKKLLPILLVAIPLAAQQPKPAPQPQAPPPEVTAALQKYQAKDLKGAIAILEPLRTKKGAPPAALALLG